MVSARVEKDYGNPKMNNIEMANIIILRQLTEKKAKNDYENCEYLITATNQSQKIALTKFSRPKILWPTLQITTAVITIAEKPLI